MKHTPKKPPRAVDEREHPRSERSPNDEPGFAGEDQRTELGKGKAIDPEWRRQFSEHNRKGSKQTGRS